MCDVSMKYLWRTCSVCLVYDAFHCGVHVQGCHGQGKKSGK